MTLAAAPFDKELVRRYDRSGPRYTSYPTAMEFSPEVGARDYAREVAKSSARGAPLSLYVHLPFCADLCLYCACNKVITPNRARATPYLDRLHAELRQRAAPVAHRPVTQLHWGGGTPTYLTDDQLRALMKALRDHFLLLPDEQAEYSIEIDPRELRPHTLAILRDVGFGRVSLGVQDFEPAVQRAVRRIQPRELTRQTLAQARALGFRSINVDLMYGLPHQTPATFERTLDQVIEARPDRLSVFNYAHLPARFKPQRRIDAAALPSAEVKLTLLQMTIERLTAAGYQHIGMDHFALVDDELARAQREGTLRRNFQGYSTQARTDLVAMGVSAISQVGGCVVQNHPDIQGYMDAVDRGALPIAHGCVLDADDHLRAAVIEALMCHGRADLTRLGRDHGVDGPRYFQGELQALAPMERDGLVTVAGATIQVSPVGRLLIRNIARIFDRYRTGDEGRFSKMI